MCLTTLLAAQCSSAACLYHWDKVNTTTLITLPHKPNLPLLEKKNGKLSLKVFFWTTTVIFTSCNEWYCLQEPCTVCHSVSNHIFCHCVTGFWTWCHRTIIKFHICQSFGQKDMLCLLQKCFTSLLTSRPSSLTFLHKIAVIMWCLLFLSLPSLSFSPFSFQCTHSVTGMAVVRQWTSCATHLSIKWEHRGKSTKRIYSQMA